MHRRAGRVDEAIAAYRAILELRPDDDIARDHLEQMYERAERWEDLVETLEEGLVMGRTGTAPETEAYALRQLATIYETRLGQPREAAAILERLDRMGDIGVEELEHLAALSERFARWESAAAALVRLADKTRGTGQAAAARRRVAEIFDLELEQSDNAIDAYRALLGEVPDDPDAYAALHSLLEVQARWAELDEVLVHRARLAGIAGRRAQLLHRRGRLLAERLGRRDDAIAVLREAMASEPYPELARDLALLAGDGDGGGDGSDQGGE